MYKHHQNTLPNMLYSLFMFNEDITRYDTCQSNLLHVEKFAFNVGHRTIIFQRGITSFLLLQNKLCCVYLII